jgi:hypothetical protein
MKTHPGKNASVIPDAAATPALRLRYLYCRSAEHIEGLFKVPRTAVEKLYKERPEFPLYVVSS